MARSRVRTILGYCLLFAAVTLVLTLLVIFAFMPMIALDYLGVAWNLMDVDTAIPLLSLTVGAKATILGFTGMILSILSLDLARARTLKDEASVLAEAAGEPSAPDRDPRKWRLPYGRWLAGEQLRKRTALIFGIIFTGLSLIAASILSDFYIVSMFLAGYTTRVIFYVWNNLFFGIALTLIVFALAVRTIWS